MPSTKPYNVELHGKFVHPSCSTRGAEIAVGRLLADEPEGTEATIWHLPTGRRVIVGVKNGPGWHAKGGDGFRPSRPLPA